MTSDTASPESKENDDDSLLAETPRDAEVGTLDVADLLFHNPPTQPPGKCPSTTPQSYA